jgi:uncharacterized protein (TIGR02246 family)
MVDNAINDLYAALHAGWNDHDGTAFAAGFTDDGVAIGFDGSEHAGRDAIARQMQAIFDDHETGRYVGAVRRVRALGGDAAILEAVAGLVPPGRDAVNPDTNARQTVVAVRDQDDGGWRIALFQNTPAQFHGRPELAEQLTEELNALV